MSNELVLADAYAGYTQTEAEAITIKTSQTARTDGGTGDAVDGVECVGNIAITLAHPLLAKIATSGRVYLTGFKLESTFVTTDQQIDNAKIVPLLNGDTMTLVNSCTAGKITFNCTRTAAGVKGGDIVSIADYLRKQGDNYGGELCISWYLNGTVRSVKLQHAVVARVQKLNLAGNDLPDHQVIFTFARDIDADVTDAITEATS